MRIASLQDQIRDVDARLLVAGERLHRYRETGADTSVRVQGAVVNRMLDERLDLMRRRDE